MKYLLSILFVCIFSVAEAAWLQKPVLCNTTIQIMQDFNLENFTPIARSTIKDNDNGNVLGTLVFLIKDRELFIVETFFATGVSCIISLTSDFTLLKTKANSSF